ncbi:MAG TPA: hypothetical protein VGK54_03920 [Chloroflexota bacterium]|jgi:hypothetical protein
MDRCVASNRTSHETALTRKLALAFAALTLLAASVSPAMAQGNVVVPPQNSYNGQTYAEWSAQWFQWVLSLPSTHHPLFDTADCSVGQRGNVWFIGGKLGAASPGLTRNCTIPEGTALFLAIANSSFDNTACSADGSTIEPTTFTIDQLRALASQNLEGFLDDKGQCTIDGVAVKKLLGPDTRFRVQSPVFDYTVPSVDNLLVLISGPCYQNLAPNLLTVSPSVADGVYVLIKPLSVGQHTIKFGNPQGHPLGHTYNITVVPAGD